MLVESPKNLVYKKKAKAFSLYFSFVNVYIFYLHGDNGKGIQNVFDTNNT